MDIDSLRKKRQLNVQEQNFLTRHKMLERALAFRRGESHLAWVRSALELYGIDPQRGILIEATAMPWGGGEQSAYAEWVGEDRQFYSFEAVIRLDTYTLMSVDTFKNITSSTSVTAHEPGKGKSTGRLALEALEQIRRADISHGGA